MQGTFVDTNIFLRHLLDDGPAHSIAAHRLIAAIEEHEVKVWTSPLVIAEIVFVLENPRTYGVTRAALREHLLPLIALPNLKLERKRIFPRVFELYVSYPIDFADAYHAALLEHEEQNTLFSFDTDFDKLPGVQRKEP
jgi:predicted nucleic acid-binding protein